MRLVTAACFLPGAIILVQAVWFAIDGITTTAEVVHFIEFPPDYWYQRFTVRRILRRVPHVVFEYVDRSDAAHRSEDSWNGPVLKRGDLIDVEYSRHLPSWSRVHSRLHFDLLFGGVLAFAGYLIFRIERRLHRATKSEEWAEFETELHERHAQLRAEHEAKARRFEERLRSDLEQDS